MADMTRRTFIGLTTIAAAGGGAAAAYSYGGNFQSEAAPSSDSEPPESVEKYRPLAADLYDELSEYYDQLGVYVREAEIAVEIRPDAESEDALVNEFKQIAELYANLIEREGHPAATLSIVAGKVQGVVPISSLRAYLNGEIDKKAYLKTVEVTDVERRNN
jgi:glycine/D-amino acid oxidase-like deaminating enzyme